MIKRAAELQVRKKWSERASQLRSASVCELVCEISVEGDSRAHWVPILQMLCVHRLEYQLATAHESWCF